MPKSKKPKENVELSDLVGHHSLSGVDFDTMEVKTYGDEFQIANAFDFA